MDRESSQGLSFSLYSNCRSAVHSLYEMYGENSEEFDGMAGTVVRGVRVQRAQAAGRGLASVKRGKDPLSMEMYEEVAGRMMKTRYGVYWHGVLTTMWNLMSRVDNAVTICRGHMEWEGDSLRIFFAHEKTDQAMEKPGFPRHVYANPLRPAICPILSLGVYFLVYDVTRMKSEFIFPRRNKKKGFEMKLQQWVDGIIEVKEREGGKKIQIRVIEKCGEKRGGKRSRSIRRYGSHSVRKGAMTFACSGSTDCPTFAALATRGGWSLGTMSIYCQYEAAGDQYVGRTLSGLNVHDESFGILPPSFKKGYEDIVEEMMGDNFGGYDEMSVEFQKVLKMTTASVVYHMEWLRKEIGWDGGHPLLGKPLFKKKYGMEELREIVEIESTWGADGKLRATGVPGHICMKHEMKEMEGRIDRMEAREEKMMEMMIELGKMMKGVEESMKELKSSEVVRSGRLKEGSKVYRELKRSMRESIEEEIEERVKKAVKAALEEREKEAEEEKEKGRGRGREEREEEGEIVNEEGREIGGFVMNSGGGKLRRVSDGFEVPSMNVEGAWICYLCRDEVSGMPPLRQIEAGDVSDRRRKIQISKLKTLMEALIEEGREKGVIGAEELVDKKEVIGERRAQEIIQKLGEVSEILKRRTAGNRPRELNKVKWGTVLADYYGEKRGKGIRRKRARMSEEKGKGGRVRRGESSGDDDDDDSEEEEMSEE